MHFFLQVYADGPVRANHLISAYSGIWRNIAARISKADILWIIADSVVGPLNCGSNEFAEKILLRFRGGRLAMSLSGKSSGNRQDQGRDNRSSNFIAEAWSFIAVAWHVWFLQTPLKQPEFLLLKLLVAEPHPQPHY